MPFIRLPDALHYVKQKDWKANALPIEIWLHCLSAYVLFRTEAWKRASTPRWLWSFLWRMRTLIVCWRRMWQQTLWGISRRSSTRWETEGWRPRPLGKDDLHQMDGWRHQIGEKLCRFFDNLQLLIFCWKDFTPDLGVSW